MKFIQLTEVGCGYCNDPDDNEKRIIDLNSVIFVTHLYNTRYIIDIMGIESNDESFSAGVRSKVAITHGNYIDCINVKETLEDIKKCL